MNSPGVWNQKNKENWGDGLISVIFEEDSGRQSRGPGLAAK